MENVIIKVVAERPSVVVNLKVTNAKAKISQIVANMFKGDKGDKGDRGLQGEKGVGIESIIKSSSVGLVDTYIINFTDSTTTSYQVTNGKDGIDGKDGTNGKDATITNATASIDNTTGTPSVNVILGGTESARTFDFHFSGIKGEKGTDGVIGKDGKSAYEYAQEGGYTRSEQEFSSDLGKIDNFITNETNTLVNYTLSTETGSKLGLSINDNYLMTLQLLDKNNNVIDTKTLDFPIESMVVNASYSNGIITLVLQNGTELPINVSALVTGLVPDTRTINGKALSSDINLSASDVGALPDTTTIPLVNNATITITQGGVNKGSFTLNQSTNETIALDAGGGDSSIILLGTTGQSTDGAMTQKATTDELNKKVEFKDLEEVEFTPNLQTQINELEDRVDNTANKDLSNVTYPANTVGSITTGSGDRVIETYISTDGLTWYRKWASGWKECGQIGITVNNTYSFPIAFNYIPTFISTVVSTRNAASYDREKYINSLTNEQFTLPYLTAACVVSFSYYACGY